MIDEEEKKKRMERAKQIAHSINQNNYSSNFNNIALNRIKANSEEEQAYIDKFQRAREITNNINPRENVLPTTVSEEDKIESQQNAEKFMELIDKNIEKPQITTENIQEPSVDNSTNKKDDNVKTDSKVNPEQQKENFENYIQNKKSSMETVSNVIKQNAEENKKAQQEKQTLIQQVNEQFKRQNPSTVKPVQNNIQQGLSDVSLANNNAIQNAKVLKSGDMYKLTDGQVDDRNKLQKSVDSVTGLTGNILMGMESVIPNIVRYMDSAGETATRKAGEYIFKEIFNTDENSAKIVGDVVFSKLWEFNEIAKANNELNSAELMKWRRETISKNTTKMSTPVGKKVSQILPSVGQNIIPMVVSYFNPLAGTTLFITSASGSYLEDAESRGMNKDQALTYSTIMGLFEGLTEQIISGKMLSNSMKLFKGSGLSNEILNSFGVSTAENFLQEAIIEPLQEAVAQWIGGKDKANWNNILNRTVTAGLDGVLSSILLGGASVGISSAVNVVDKKNITDKEMQKAIFDTINSGKIDINSIINGATDAIKDSKFYINTEKFFINETNENNQIIEVLGTQIESINPKLNIQPAVVKKDNSFIIIDAETGLKLDTSSYISQTDAIKNFNDKIRNIDTATIKNINNKITQAKLSLINKLEKNATDNELLSKENANKYLNNKGISFNLGNRPYLKKELEDIINAQPVKTNNEQSTSTFYNNETKYAVPDIKKITEPFNAQQEYTKEEMADVWNDEISENEYDVTYGDNNNIQSYIAIEEDGNNLVVNQYDNEDNLIKSEVILAENGKYNAETIKNTIEKVSRVYDENKPINGQVDIEGNEVRSMRKENNKKISPKRYNQIRDIVKYNQDGKEIKDNNYVDFIVERYKDNINISNIETNTQNIEQLLNETLEEAKNIVGVDNENKIKNKQKELMINNLYPTIKDTEFLTIKNLQNTDGTYATKKLNIEISKGGLKESFNKSISKEKYAVIPFLDILIKTSNDGIIRAESKDRRNISEWYYLYNTAIVNGKLYSVKIDIKKTTQGDKFYVHRLNIIKEGSTTSVSIVEDDTKRSNLKPSNINNSISQNQKSVKNDTIINNKSIQNKENNTTRAIKKQNGGLTKTQYDSEGREITFKQSQYFKESKVRDENGNLLVVYHGSTSEFTIFDAKKSGQASKESKVGFWFTETKEGAENFANSLWYGDKKAISYETYLNIKNPKVYNSIDNSIELENIDNRMKEQKNIIRKLENKNIAIEMNKQELKWATSKEELQEIAKIEGIDFEDAERYHNAIKKYNDLEEEYDNKKYGDSYEQFRTDIYKIANKSASDANFGGTGMWLENENEIISKFKQQLIDDGYDGIIIKNTKYDSDTMGRDNNQYVAFYPEQIKKVDNTNPTSNEDIRFAKRTAKSQDKTQRNAERGESYIEQEIKKIEASGNWDNSIPVTKMSDIRKTIENYLGLGIKKGHFRQQAYAIYKGNRDIIRTKELKDMDSILHETGHALDIGKRLDIDKESIADELLTAINKLGGYEGETRTIRLEEGFAEVIREYSIIPEQAKIEYPQTIAVIQKIRQNDKSFDKFISKVQQQTYNYIHQNPRNRALSNMSIGEKTDKQPLTIDWVKQEVMRNVYDSDYVIKSIQNELAKKKGKTTNSVKASNNIYLLTRLANASHSKAISMLSEGYINLNGNKTMPGLNKIGEILGNNPERYNDLRAYLVAQRDLEYKSKTLKTGIRTMDSKTIVEQFKNDTQILEAAKVIYDTLDGVLQYAVDNHLIDTAMAEKLRESNAFYVPMQRVLENDKGNKIGHRGAVADIMKKRTGSELDIKDVLENIVTNSANIIQQVDNNNALKALYNQGEEVGITGTVYDVISTPMVKIGTANLAMWEKELKNQGVNTNNLDLEKTIDIFVPDKKIDTKNLITSFIDDNGKRIYLQFNDELTFNAVTGMDKQFMSSVLKINAKMNMPLRYGATMANLGFAIPNMISDTAQATIFSTAGFIPIIDNVIGVLDVLTANNKSVKNFMNKVAPDYVKKVNLMYSLYNQSGATSSTRMSQYRKSAQEMMENVYGTKSSNLGIEDKFKPLKRLLDLLTYIPEISEQSTRLRVFEKNYDYYKNKGTSEMDTRIMAAIEARNATQDFSRTGNLTREINQLIPFSAARVGSAYTFAEKIKANPKQVSMRIAILTALAMTIKAIGYDDDEIQELNQRKKDDNFVFKIGDSVVTIKKPQGILRSIINLAEYIEDLATGHIDEGKEGERLEEWLHNAITDNLPSDSFLTAIGSASFVGVLAENKANKDFYYNTDIVKSYDLDLPDSEQYYDYNSQLAIWLGKVFNYSPAKIDNAISGWFGGLGTQVTDIIDLGLSKIGAIPEQPEMGAEDNAVGKRFFVNVNSNSSSVDEIYDRKTELTKLKNGGTITEEETQELETITDAISNLSNLNKQIKEIKKDLSMSGKEKAEKIKLLQQEKTDTARKALGKEVIYPENESKIQSTQFYPNETLKKSGYTLTLNTEQKKEYEELANSYYSKYEKQGIYNEEKLEDIKSKAKEYAKNEMFKKYKSELVKTKK